MADGDRFVVAVGSNIAPQKNLPAALERLRAQVEVAGVSRVYETAPVAAPGTPDFLNAAILVSSGLSPGRLKLDVLRPIEAQLGRRRGADRNAPRPIDLDIVLWTAGALDDRRHDLRLPDRNLTVFAHLALPVAELVPDWLDAVTGRTLAEIAAGLSQPFRVVELPGWRATAS
jgi:2-amino-4-hydroxy-6-hydroxymethyldihydropteridine diphosphokinase